MNKENNKEVFQCICGKQFDNKKSFSHHKSACKIYRDSIKDRKLKEQQEKESKRLPNGMFKCENPDCGKEHDGSYGSGRFCSSHCRRVYSGKHVNINGNQKCNFFNFGKRISKCAKHGTWKCERCNLIFETRAQLFNHNHKVHPVPKGQAWNKGLTKKIDKRIAKYGQTTSNGYKLGRLIPYNKGKIKPEKEKEKIRISTFKYLQKTKNISQPRYNINSIPFFDNLSKERGWNLQHAENGGEITVLGYWLDAYDKERNIVVEYDEPAHYIDIENNILCEKDIKRQQKIIDHLHCEFWRYNESMNLLYKIFS